MLRIEALDLIHKLAGAAGLVRRVEEEPERLILRRPVPHNRSPIL